MAIAKKNLHQSLKIAESVCWGLGPALFALNFFSFKLHQWGFYYKPGAEWGMAIGVLFISLAFIARYWQK